MGAGRKLKKFRIKQMRWAHKPYTKASCCPPYGRVQWKKPRIRIDAYNSFISKCVKIHLINNGKKINVFIPDDGRLNYIEEDVLIAEFERKGHAVGDISFKTLRPRVKGRIWRSQGLK